MGVRIGPQGPEAHQWDRDDTVATVKRFTASVGERTSTAAFTDSAVYNELCAVLRLPESSRSVPLAALAASVAPPGQQLAVEAGLVLRGLAQTIDLHCCCVEFKLVVASAGRGLDDKEVSRGTKRALKAERKQLMQRMNEYDALCRVIGSQEPQLGALYLSIAETSTDPAAVRSISAQVSPMSHGFTRDNVAPHLAARLYGAVHLRDRAVEQLTRSVHDAVCARNYYEAGLLSLTKVHDESISIVSDSGLSAELRRGLQLTWCWRFENYQHAFAMFSQIAHELGSSVRAGKHTLVMPRAGGAVRLPAAEPLPPSSACWNSLWPTIQLRPDAHQSSYDNKRNSCYVATLMEIGYRLMSPALQADLMSAEAGGSSGLHTLLSGYSQRTAGLRGTADLASQKDRVMEWVTSTGL